MGWPSQSSHRYEASIRGMCRILTHLSIVNAFRIENAHTIDLQRIDGALHTMNMLRSSRKAEKKTYKKLNSILLRCAHKFRQINYFLVIAR